MENEINMKSEIETNQNIVTVGDNLIYSDADNLQHWVVTEIIDGGFVAHNREQEEGDEFSDGIDMFLFSELQIGWTFTEKTRQNKKIIK